MSLTYIRLSIVLKYSYLKTQNFKCFFLPQTFGWITDTVLMYDTSKEECQCMYCTKISAIYNFEYNLMILRYVS